jgi:hypothetical protein
MFKLIDGFVNIFLKSIGLYWFFSGEVYKVDVKDPPQGITPPNQTEKKPHHTSKVSYTFSYFHIVLY